MVKHSLELYLKIYNSTVVDAILDHVLQAAIVSNLNVTGICLAI